MLTDGNIATSEHFSNLVEAAAASSPTSFLSSSTRPDSNGELSSTPKTTCGTNTTPSPLDDGYTLIPRKGVRISHWFMIWVGGRSRVIALRSARVGRKM